MIRQEPLAFAYLKPSHLYPLQVSNYRRAVRDLHALLKLTPGTTAIHNMMGTSLAAMGRCTEAITAYVQPSRDM